MPVCGDAGSKACRAQAGEVVGDENLLEVSPGDEPCAIAQLLARDRARAVDLRQQRRRAQDRSGDQVRKEGDEHGEIQQVPRRGDLPSIHVDDVAHRHERVERDPDRQEDVQRDEVDLPAERSEDAVQAVGEEIEVFEEPQERQVEAEADREEWRVASLR